MKKVFIILISIILILVVAAGITFLVLKNKYENGLKPVNSEANSEEKVIEIKEGMNTTTIAELLEKENIIQSAVVFRVYAKLNNISNLQAGKYQFENGKENVEQIIKKLASGEVMDETIKMTFVEGKTIKDYAKLIADNTSNTEEDVYNLLKDEEYIDSLIEKYWFLTDEIKNEDIYYPLEGYFNPDTYVFENKDVSVEYIFSYILNYTDKILSEHKSEIEASEYSVHELLTLASLVELEGKGEEARNGIAGVFYNRLKMGMNLGSDVTTYYAFDVDMGESDLTKTQINTYNPYNTRGPNMDGKLPIGPICNPSITSINAVLNPTNTDAYYFVADKNGEVYFTKTYQEHQEIINKLKQEGLWFVYE